MTRFLSVVLCLSLCSIASAQVLGRWKEPTEAAWANCTDSQLTNAVTPVHECSTVVKQTLVGELFYTQYLICMAARSCNKCGRVPIAPGPNNFVTVTGGTYLQHSISYSLPSRFDPGYHVCDLQISLNVSSTLTQGVVVSWTLKSHGGIAVTASTPALKPHSLIDWVATPSVSVGNSCSAVVYSQWSCNVDNSAHCTGSNCLAVPNHPHKTSNVYTAAAVTIGSAPATLNSRICVPIGCSTGLCLAIASACREANMTTIGSSIDGGNAGARATSEATYSNLKGFLVADNVDVRTDSLTRFFETQIQTLKEPPFFVFHVPGKDAIGPATVYSSEAFGKTLETNVLGLHKSWQLATSCQGPNDDYPNLSGTAYKKFFGICSTSSITKVPTIEIYSSGKGAGFSHFVTLVQEFLSRILGGTDTIPPPYCIFPDSMHTNWGNPTDNIYGADLIPYTDPRILGAAAGFFSFINSTAAADVGDIADQIFNEAVAPNYAHNMLEGGDGSHTFGAYNRAYDSAASFDENLSQALENSTEGGILALIGTPTFAGLNSLVYGIAPTTSLGATTTNEYNTIRGWAPSAAFTAAAAAASNSAKRGVRNTSGRIPAPKIELRKRALCASELAVLLRTSN